MRRGGKTFCVKIVMNRSNRLAGGDDVSTMAVSGFLGAKQNRISLLPRSHNQYSDASLCINSLTIGFNCEDDLLLVCG